MPFRDSKSLKIELSEYGSYLGRDAGCFELRNKEGKVKHYPHFEKATAYFMLRKAGANFVNKFDRNADIGWFWDSQIKLEKKTDKMFDFTKELRFLNFFLVNFLTTGFSVVSVILSK